MKKKKKKTNKSQYLKPLNILDEKEMGKIYGDTQLVRCAPGIDAPGSTGGGGCNCNLSTRVGFIQGCEPYCTSQPSGYCNSYCNGRNGAVCSSPCNNPVGCTTFCSGNRGMGGYICTNCCGNQNYYTTNCSSYVPCVT